MGGRLNPNTEVDILAHQANSLPSFCMIGVTPQSKPSFIFQKIKLKKKNYIDQDHMFFNAKILIVDHGEEIIDFALPRSTPNKTHILIKHSIVFLYNHNYQINQFPVGLNEWNYYCYFSIILQLIRKIVPN